MELMGIELMHRQPYNVEYYLIRTGPSSSIMFCIPSFSRNTIPILADLWILDESNQYVVL